MYARVAYAQIKKGMMGDFTKFWKEVQAGNRKVKGYKGASLLVSSDKVLSITMYETEADMKATASAHNERIKARSGLWANTPTTEHYEVVAQV